ncbi:hypothetical protein T265_15830, partial [Opisthorchis viverrini]
VCTSVCTSRGLENQTNTAGSPSPTPASTDLSYPKPYVVAKRFLSLSYKHQLPLKLWMRRRPRDIFLPAVIKQLAIE